MKFIVLAVIILGICLFIKIQNHKKQLAEQQVAELRKQQVKQRAEEINVQIAELDKNIDEILHTRWKDGDGNREKIRELNKQIDVLEKERYELTGQPTRKEKRAGLGILSTEQWNKKHGIVTEQKQKTEQPVPKKSANNKMPWFAVGMAANELKHKNAELKRQNKELKKAIDKINKTK